MSDTREAADPHPRDPCGYAEWIAVSLQDKDSHSGRAELMGAIRLGERRTTPGRPEGKTEADHSDGARRLRDATGHPRAARTPDQTERRTWRPLSADRRQRVEEHRVQKTRGIWGPASGNPVGLIKSYRGNAARGERVGEKGKRRRGRVRARAMENERDTRSPVRAGGPMNRRTRQPSSGRHLHDRRCDSLGGRRAVDQRLLRRRLRHAPVARLCRRWSRDARRRASCGARRPSSHPRLPRCRCGPARRRDTHRGQDTIGRRNERAPHGRTRCRAGRRRQDPRWRHTRRPRATAVCRERRERLGIASRRRPCVPGRES